MVVELFAFADESGINRGDSYCVVAGYAGSFRQWNVVAAEWDAVLQEFGITRFHAHEFFAEGTRVGPYQGSSESDRNRFLDRLLAVIWHSGVHPIGGAVNLAAFYALTVGERRALTGGRMSDRGKWTWKRSTGAPTRPYYLGFNFFVVDALELARSDTMIHFSFDQQQVLKDHAVRVFTGIVDREFEKHHERLPSKALSLGGLRFESSAQLPPLQAADLYTHIWYSYLTRREGLSEERQSALYRLTFGRRKGMPEYGAEELEQNLSQFSPEIRERLRAETS